MEIALALGGGGARCFAQIGALRALEENGYTVVAVTACSTAAFIGALIAAGHGAAAIERIVRGANYRQLLNLKGHAGLMSQDPVRELLRPHLPATFEELALPLAVTSVDLQEGELVVLSSGDLLLSISASNAFPGLFNPVSLNGRDLIDGGVLNLVPVDILRGMTTAPVLAVDVSLSRKRRIDLDKKEGFLKRLARPFVKKRLPLFLDLLDKAYVITQNHVTERRYADCPPDMLVKPDFEDDFRIQDFDRLDEALALGYEKTLQTLKEQPVKAAPSL